MKILFNFIRILFGLLPFLYILTIVCLVMNIDKKLVYKVVTIQYENNLSKFEERNIGIDFFFTGYGVKARFYTKEYPNRLFQNYYFGFLKYLLVSGYYNRLVDKQLDIVGLYVDPYYLERPLSKKSESIIQFGNTQNIVPFFYIDQGKEKSIYYYLDIFCYVSYNYGFVLVISFLFIFIFGYGPAFENAQGGRYTFMCISTGLSILIALLSTIIQ